MGVYVHALFGALGPEGRRKGRQNEVMGDRRMVRLRSRVLAGSVGDAEGGTPCIGWHVVRLQSRRRTWLSRR